MPSGPVLLWNVMDQDHRCGIEPDVMSWSRTGGSELGFAPLQFGMSLQAAPSPWEEPNGKFPGLIRVTSEAMPWLFLADE